jgi:hypothetical protein
MLSNHLRHHLRVRVSFFSSVESLELPVARGDRTRGCRTPAESSAEDSLLRFTARELRCECQSRSSSGPEIFET